MRVLTVIFAGFALLVIAAILSGAAFMLLLGAAHSYNAVIPALGFAESFFLALALRIATTDAKAHASSK